MPAKLNSRLSPRLYPAQKQDLNSLSRNASAQQDTRNFGPSGKAFTELLIAQVLTYSARDPYSNDIAPLAIFKKQVVAVGIHNISKSFRPNLASMKVSKEIDKNKRCATILVSLRGG